MKKAVNISNNSIFPNFHRWNFKYPEYRNTTFSYNTGFVRIKSQTTIYITQLRYANSTTVEQSVYVIPNAA